MEVDHPDRGKARDRAILRTFVAGAGLQVAVGLSTLAALPFVTRQLTAAEFGVFATLTGFAVLLSFADFGIGGALTTDMAHARGRDDLEAARSVVSTAVVASIVVGAGTTALLVVSIWLVPWRSLLGAGDVHSSDLHAALVVAALAIGASVPAAIGQRLLYGVHRGGLANIWLLAGAVTAASLLVGGALWDWPLAGFVFVALGAPVCAGIACGLTALRVAPELTPSLRLASASEWRRLRASSGWHFAIGLAGAVSFQTDVLVVSSILGAATAGIFAVSGRIFGLITQSLYPAMLQLWPAFGEAHARNDASWIKSRLMRVTAMSGGLSLLGGLFIVAFGQEIIGAWLTDELVPTRSLLIALACWTTYSLVSAPSFLLLNATGRVRVHGITAIAVAIANLPLSIALTHIVGVSGPVWGSLISSATISAAPWFLSVRGVLAEAEQRAAT